MPKKPVNKFYAVRVGLVPGIYTNWEQCAVQVYGFPKAQYKSFFTEEAALAYMRGEEIPNSGAKRNGKSHKKKVVVPPPPIEEPMPNIYGFIDGAYNEDNDSYGFGGYVMVDGEKYEISGSGDDADLVSMKDVAGELIGTKKILDFATEHHLREITILYDYKGVDCWATGKWKRNLPGTVEYYEYCQNKMLSVNVIFRKILDIKQIEGNEEAKSLANLACGNI